jgi:hypothetical protein
MQLKFGPYKPPRARKGSVLVDECYGKVTVIGRTVALVKWPAHSHRGKLLPVLTGDLVKALILENEQAVSNAFGVSRYHIDMWKRALTGETSSCDVHAALVMLRADQTFRSKHGLPEP